MQFSSIVFRKTTTLSKTSRQGVSHFEEKGRIIHHGCIFWAGGEWIEITVDSVAEESVCPQSRRGTYGMSEVRQKMNLVNASGGKINYYG